MNEKIDKILPQVKEVLHEANEKINKLFASIEVNQQIELSAAVFHIDVDKMPIDSRLNKTRERNWLTYDIDNLINLYSKDL